MPAEARDPKEGFVGCPATTEAYICKFHDNKRYSQLQGWNAAAWPTRTSIVRAGSLPRRLGAQIV